MKLIIPNINPLFPTVPNAASPPQQRFQVILGKLGKISKEYHI